MWLINALKAILAAFGKNSKTEVKPASVVPGPMTEEYWFTDPVTDKVTPPMNDMPVQDTSHDNRTFVEALRLVLKYEGGYSNNPADHGGATNKGIIQREYDRYRVSVGKIPQSVQFIEDSEVEDIYHKNYWDAGKCFYLPVEIAIVHFDTCVNCGVKQASKFLQRAIPVTDDGVIGPATIAALNKKIQEKASFNILHSYLEQRANFYYALVEKDPSQKVFIKGWQTRISQLTNYIEKRGASDIVSV